MDNENSKVRIATVTATGRRYVVQMVADNGRCCLWGEVVGVRGRSLTHGKALWCDVAEVTIAWVERTESLCVALFEETLAAKRSAGHLLVSSGRKRVRVTDLGTRADVAGRIASRERFVAENPALVAVARDLGVDLASLGAADRAALAALAGGA